MPLLSVSTDPRQRVADQLIHHPPTAEARLHQHHARGLGAHLADLGRLARSPAPRAAPRARASAASGATNATSLPSLATYIGSIPRISAAPATAGMHRHGALAHDHRHRRRAGELVQHRCDAAAGGVAHAAQLAARPPPAARRPPATASGCPTRSTASSSNSLRASMIAVPCSPMLPDRMMRSPGRSAAGDSVARGSRRPRPVVHTYMPSAWPRSTTLVSPATISTPAVARCRGDRLDLGPQVVGRQALLQHQRQAQRERPGARRRPDR